MMADSVWSETPPTQPGWYWVQNRHGYAVEEVILLRDGRFYWFREWFSAAEVTREVRFGPRCPSAEELAALSRLQRRERPDDAEIDAVLRELFGVDDPKNRVTKLEEPT